MTRRHSFVFVLSTLAMGGCASLTIDRNISEGAALVQENAGAAPTLRWADEAREGARAEVDRILDSPLPVDDAARIAVAFSPSFQAMLFESSARSAEATQAARLPNPLFTFERLIRREDGNVSKDINRMIGFSVFDLLLLPARLRAADFQQQHLRAGIAGDIVLTAAAARQAWIRAVAAQQSVTYAEQVKSAADASADLARRMQQVGNTRINLDKLQAAQPLHLAGSAIDFQ